MAPLKSSSEFHLASAFRITILQMNLLLIRKKWSRCPVPCCGLDKREGVVEWAVLEAWDMVELV